MAKEHLVKESIVLGLDVKIDELKQTLSSLELQRIHLVKLITKLETFKKEIWNMEARRHGMGACKRKKVKSL